MPPAQCCQHAGAHDIRLWVHTRRFQRSELRNFAPAERRRMQALSSRRMLLLTAAVTLSLATAMIVRAWVNEARLNATAGTADIPKAAVTKILVATHALPAGQFLQPNDLE